MNWALDAGLIVFFAVTVIFYTLRGIFASVWGAAKAVLSLIGAYILGPYAGTFLYNSLLSEKMNKPELALLLSKILGYIAAFFILLILLSIVGIIIGSRLKKNPLLCSVNRIFGFCLGTVAGFIYVWVLCWVISFAVEKHLAGTSTDAVRQIAENSILFRFFCNISPMDYISILKLGK